MWICGEVLQHVRQGMIFMYNKALRGLEPVLLLLMFLG